MTARAAPATGATPGTGRAFARWRTPAPKPSGTSNGPSASASGRRRRTDRWTAVAQLLHLDRQPPPVYKGRHDPKVLVEALATMHRH